MTRRQWDADAEPAEIPDTCPSGWVIAGHSGQWWDDTASNIDEAIRCPYGVPGDRLWVRETFVLEHAVESDQPPPHDDGRPIKRAPADDVDCQEPAWIQPHYRATDPAPDLEYEEDEDPQPRVKWRPSIFMPRWASRITLEVTDVRVERLQEISEADAVAEGGPPSHPSIDQISREYGYVDFPRSWYAQLWESINGAGSWDANPWVWVVAFRRLRQARSTASPSPLPTAATGDDSART